MAGRPSLNEINEYVSSPVDAGAFLVRFSAIPGSGLDIFNNRDLTVRCQSCSWPGMGVGIVTVDMMGHQLKFAGKREPAEPVTMRFMESGKMETYKKLRGWHEFIRNSSSVTSGARKNLANFSAGQIGLPGYSSQVSITPLTGKNESAGTLVLVNAWVSNLGGWEHDGSSSTPIVPEITLQYDQHYFGNLGLGLGIDASSLTLDNASQALDTFRGFFS